MDQHERDMKMKNCLILAFAAILLAGAAASSRGVEEARTPAYKLRVRVDPGSHAISCRAVITDPGDSCFILNSGMAIRRILADNKPAAYQTRPSRFMPNASEVVLTSGIPDTIEFEYAGSFNAGAYPPILSSANMVTPELVEMAFYLTWYPRMNTARPFDFQLSADLPSEYATVTNGSLVSERSEGGRRVTDWQSYQPGTDIVLLAAPGLKRSVISRNGMTVELYYDRVPDSYIDSMKTELLRSMERLTALFGPSGSTPLIRVAYSPRNAWGYVRAPFIIVSEGNALSWRTGKFGSARDFRYLTHEMAHYWWGFADTNTPDDWLNEGLAEYSALEVSEELVGKDFADQLRKEYRSRIAASTSETPIAATQGGSPDRELNRYDKPTLLFDQARRRYGSEGWDAFLRALYLRFAETHVATTEAFLDEVGKRLGNDARIRFAGVLYAKTWKGEDAFKR